MRLGNRPVFLLRVVGVPTVIVAGLVVALVLDQPVLILVGASLAVGLYFLSPWAWRRLVHDPERP